MSINISLTQRNNFQATNRKKTQKNPTVSFGAASAPVYAVKNSSLLSKALPVLAFFASSVTCIGYALGSLGLFYDSYKENGSNLKKTILATKQKSSDSEGVKTIKTTTTVGKIGLNAAKIAITASASAGVACGLGEGMPMMALGESTNMTAGRIIETPVGTGLFGIGIASIFSSLALDNTPELKLNHYKLMAEKDTGKKAKMIANNMLATVKEIGSSVIDIAKNIYKPSFYKENFLQLSPRTVVFQEVINKDGKVTIQKALRHNKNYLMHAASFVLTIGGMGVIAFSALKNKTAQKASLHAEEGGFLCDNFGMLKYGLDKFTTGAKAAGSGYGIGGLINSASQIIGLDNKNGRAMQWLGIALVFIGYSVDRGRTLQKKLLEAKFRPELQDVVREWKFDLSKFVDKNKPEELKALLKDLNDPKKSTTSNPKFNAAVAAFEKATTQGKFKTQEDVKKELSTKLGKDVAENFTPKDIADYEETKNILKACTKKIFGTETPTPTQSPKK